jgi:hypothetical protein
MKLIVSGEGQKVATKQIIFQGLNTLDIYMCTLFLKHFIANVGAVVAMIAR